MGVVKRVKRVVSKTQKRARKARFFYFLCEWAENPYPMRPCRKSGEIKKCFSKMQNKKTKK
jgi:hypothetical protein